MQAKKSSPETDLAHPNNLLTLVLILKSNISYNIFKIQKHVLSFNAWPQVLLLAPGPGSGWVYVLTIFRFPK